MSEQVVSVKQLNMYVKSLIESDANLLRITVKGEILNFKNHYSSGHLYFTLKDNDASIRCVMFRSYAQRVKFDACDGMQVLITGRVSLYEKDGQYQFYAEEMREDGLGDIARKFEQIKEKLAKEGLFDIESKRPIPKFPEKIAVITSPTGAAVRDIMNILSRRYPIAKVLMCPVSVQGELAVPEMLSALDKVYESGEADVIIIGRGGGSIEDLWAFNSEELARKIYESPIPVISAVGHETDFTICDFVSDLRAPTPSAAAELAVPDMADIYLRIEKAQSAIKTALVSKYNLCKLRLESAISAQSFKSAKDEIIGKRFEDLDMLNEKLALGLEKRFIKSENEFSVLVSKLDSLSPLKVLGRGYAVAKKGEKVIKSIGSVEANDNIDLTLSDGVVNCTVIGKE